MNHADAFSRLEEYFDGSLPAGIHREIEAHLGSCPACREELTSLGALLDTVAKLREREVEPERDLWPEIALRLANPDEAGRARTTGGTVPPDAIPIPGYGRDLPAPAWRNRSRRALVFGSAGLAVAAAALWLLWPKAEVTSTAEVASGGVVASELSALDLEVKSARQSIQPAAPSDTSAAGASWRDFDRGLAVLDAALRESRAALARDPGNPILQESVLAAYQKQLELIRWANRVVRQS